MKILLIAIILIANITGNLGFAQNVQPNNQLTTYVVKAPDGKTYTIDGPPGASPETVLRVVIAKNPAAGISRKTPSNPDLSQMSSSDLEALAKGDTSSISDAGKKILNIMVLIPEEKKYSVDYYNECKLKTSIDAKNESALKVAIQVCQYKAIPKKCRSYKIEKDINGNEIGAERVQCIEECSKANLYSKHYGECSVG